MAMVTTRQSGEEFHQAVMTFYDFARRIGRNEKMDARQIQTELTKLAKFIVNEDSAATFAGALKLVTDLSDPNPTTIAPVRVKPVNWSKHSKGKERSWMATWEGMRLLVIRKKTGDQGVIFDGSVDGEDVTRGKLLTQVQTTLASEAYERFRSR